MDAFEAMMQDEALSHADVVALCEASGLRHKDEWDAIVAGHDDDTIRQLIGYGAIDALTRMAEGDTEGFMQATYAVALLGVERDRRAAL